MNSWIEHLKEEKQADYFKSVMEFVEQERQPPNGVVAADPRGQAAAVDRRDGDRCRCRHICVAMAAQRTAQEQQQERGRRERVPRRRQYSGTSSMRRHRRSPRSASSR